MITKENFEVDNQTGVNHEGPKANVPVKRLTATSIIGDTVENLSGEELGTIDNLMINLSTGEIEYVVLEYGSVLGIGGKFFAIPFSEFTVDEEKEVFIVNRTVEYLKNAPGFDKDHWPATNDHDNDEYFNNVDRYYENTPGMTGFSAGTTGLTGI